MTREHPAAGAGPACARQGERVELAFAGMRANIRRDLRHARLSRTDLGRGGTHVPAFGIITDGLPEDQPSQVKRRSDVGRGDRQHDDHPDVIAATADLGVDTRAYNRRAFLLGKAAAETWTYRGPVASLRGEPSAVVLTNALVTWTTEYYTLAVRQLRADGRSVPDELLSHISPGGPGHRPSSRSWAGRSGRHPPVSLASSASMSTLMTPKKLMLSE